MRYIKGHKYGIEERARRHYGETEDFGLAGYILEDGTMLNFSYEGYQRDEDHRNIGQFFSTAQNTAAMLKFMRRGNVRVMCDSNGMRFEYIKPLTEAQKRMIRIARREAGECWMPFLLEKDNKKGKSIRRSNGEDDPWYNETILGYSYSY